MNFLAIIPLLGGILSGLPSLIKGVEALFSGQPKSGPQKWIAIEQALSQSIAQVAQFVEANVPNAKADAVAADVTKWVKQVNDSLVSLFNSLGVFQH